MKRVIRMIVLLTAATVVATHSPVNAILVLVVALSFDEMVIGDFFIIWVSALFMDHSGILPLATSFLPLILVYIFLHLLKNLIYVNNFMSRVVWASLSTILYGVISTCILTIRDGEALYLWKVFLHQVPMFIFLGILAAAVSPILRYCLTITWDELRRPNSIVVP
ncbi:MAG: hypothetical protein COV45_07360 [Deltaproteobacteria bacterium CG11_big_fil_rev_8_21_14_0_20_47_16]|nr:MAG: hypothetical protein COV45_07360 [Deltaproteobacteria bacterium CG11_big_fil_rev_8_21_14_0_20_47_16]